MRGLMLWTCGFEMFRDILRRCWGGAFVDATDLDRQAGIGGIAQE